NKGSEMTGSTSRLNHETNFGASSTTWITKTTGARRARYPMNRSWRRLCSMGGTSGGYHPLRRSERRVATSHPLPQPPRHERHPQPVAAVFLDDEPASAERAVERLIFRARLRLDSAEAAQVVPLARQARFSLQQLQKDVVAAHHGAIERAYEERTVNRGAACIVHEVNDGFRDELYKMRPAPRLGMDALDTTLTPEARLEARRL